MTRGMRTTGFASPSFFSLNGLTTPDQGIPALHGIWEVAGDVEPSGDTSPLARATSALDSRAFDSAQPMVRGNDGEGAEASTNFTSLIADS